MSLTTVARLPVSRLAKAFWRESSIGPSCPQKYSRFATGILAIQLTNIEEGKGENRRGVHRKNNFYHSANNALL